MTNLWAVIKGSDNGLINYYKQSSYFNWSQMNRLLLNFHPSMAKDPISEMCSVQHTRQQTQFRNQEILELMFCLIKNGEFLEQSVPTLQSPCTLCSE